MRSCSRSSKERSEQLDEPGGLLPVAMPHAKTGRLRMLAVTGLQRSKPQSLAVTCLQREIAWPPRNVLLDFIRDNKVQHYEPYGWHRWPDHPALSLRFRRALGETQQGGNAAIGQELAMDWLSDVFKVDPMAS
jgi:hypothetical protein